MKKKEFIDNYCRGMSKEEREDFLATQVVVPCHCKEEGCNGWWMKDKKLHEREVKSGYYKP